MTKPLRNCRKTWRRCARVPWLALVPAWPALAPNIPTIQSRARLFCWSINADPYPQLPCSASTMRCLQAMLAIELFRPSHAFGSAMICRSARMPLVPEINTILDELTCGPRLHGGDHVRQWCSCLGIFERPDQTKTAAAALGYAGYWAMPTSF